MANDFKEVRLASFNASEKLRRGEKLTAAEIENIRDYARMNPTAENIGLYAIAKKSLEQENDED